MIFLYFESGIRFPDIQVTSRSYHTKSLDADDLT